MFLIILLLLASTGLAWNLDNKYAPTRVACPSEITNLLRDANGLNPDEAAWVESRHENTMPAMVQYMERMKMKDFDPEAFLHNTSISLGLAFSGGGYRAMLSAAGEFAALDNRTSGSTDPGHIGGLVQAATYFTGLSGGSWFLGSVVANNFSTIDNLMSSKDVWNLAYSITNPGGFNLVCNADYYRNLATGILAKRSSGFNVSVTDIWGRALSQQFIDLDGGGPAMTWNDIQNYKPYMSHQMPLPIIVTDGRAPDSKIISINSTLFEITPYELGSWDPSLGTFTDLKWIGTNVINGIPVNNSCVMGYDNTGYIMGTSSSLFNEFLFYVNSTVITGAMKQLATQMLGGFDRTLQDVALYKPNPFFRDKKVHSSIETSDFLALVDGGEDGQNVPLNPLLQPERNVDAIIAFDNSADVNSWAAGVSLEASYARQFGTQARNYFFPPVPDSNTFINNKLNQRPVFFGCYASNFTDLRTQTKAPSSYTPPIIIWNSNGYYSFRSNTSTFKMSYSDYEMRSMVQNTYAVATYGNGTIDPEYGACIGCALIQREVERRGINQTYQCKQCFDRYCWDGSLNSTIPSKQQTNQLWSVSNTPNSAILKEHHDHQEIAGKTCSPKYSNSRNQNSGYQEGCVPVCYPDGRCDMVWVDALGNPKICSDRRTTPQLGSTTQRIGNDIQNHGPSTDS